MSFLNDHGLKTQWEEIQSSIAKALQFKVTKVEGKGLSTNDYTNEDKETLAELVKISSKSVSSVNGQIPDENGNIELEITKSGVPYQQLVTDADGNTVWEDRIFYSEGVTYNQCIIYTYSDVTISDSSSYISLEEHREGDIQHGMPYKIQIADVKTENDNGEYLWNTYYATARVLIESMNISIAVYDDTGNYLFAIVKAGSNNWDGCTVENIYIKDLPGGDYRIAVFEGFESYVTIPDKYIPPTIIRSWDINQYNSTLKNITTDDAGKILSVDSGGKWAVTEMPPDSWNDLTDKPFGIETSISWSEKKTVNTGVTTYFSFDGSVIKGYFDDIPFEFKSASTGGYVYYGKEEYDNGLYDFYFGRHVTGDPCGVMLRESGEHIIVYQTGDTSTTVNKIPDLYLPNNIMYVNNDKPNEQVVMASTTGGSVTDFYYNSTEVPIDVLYMKSAGGKMFRVIVSDDGTLSATEVTE